MPLIAILLVGCGIAVVNPPKIPSIPYIVVNNAHEKPAEFNPAVPLNLRFIEKSGKSIQTQDNVTVAVTSITDSIDDAEYTVSIDGPDDKSYTYSLFPMMLVLEIKNNTDHIIRLTRTIIHIEDENQIEYPLISSFNENKLWLIKEIEKSFDEYKKQSQFNADTKQIADEYIEQYRKVVFGSYQSEYNQFSEKLLKAHKDPSKEGVRTPDVPSGKYFTDHGIQLKLMEYKPDQIFFKGQNEIKAKISQETAIKYSSQQAQNEIKIDALKKDAVEKINNLPSLSGLITSGEYLPISILPGRSKKIIAPISKRFSEEKIKEVNVSVFDLPTKVNAAGDPIKRTNFHYHFMTERF